jgi:ABC-type multidrug transport system fused ATPase/permease subunit
MRELTNLYHQGMTVLSSAQSVFGILDEHVAVRDPERPAQPVTTKLRPEISFDGVSFGYQGGHRPALEGASFDLREGETLGVVGASGAGKSTLVWLMYRFYDPRLGPSNWEATI